MFWRRKAKRVETPERTPVQGVFDLEVRSAIEKCLRGSYGVSSLSVFGSLDLVAYVEPGDNGRGMVVMARFQLPDQDRNMGIAAFYFDPEALDIKMFETVSTGPVPQAPDTAEAAEVPREEEARTVLGMRVAS